MAFAIGIENNKNGQNLGTLLRSSHVFGASLVFTIGRPYVKMSSDVTKAYRHIPVLRFVSWEDYLEHTPHQWEHIGIELSDKAISLSRFKHPKSCVYLLGPEDGSLSQRALDICTAIVEIAPTDPNCLNVATAGSLVMYDRYSKQEEIKP